MLHVILGVISVLTVQNLAVASTLELEGLEGAVIQSTSEDPFLVDPEPIEPTTKKKVDRVLVGPTLRTKLGSEYDYYRFVTYHKVSQTKERVFSLPIHRENCGDSAVIAFANYSFSYSLTTKISASVSIEGIGLSADMSQTRTLTTSRQLQASGKHVADHTPYIVKEHWKGLTYMQVYSKKTGKVSILRRDSFDDVPLFVKAVAPSVLLLRKYPMPFEAKDAAWLFTVERKVISSCDQDEGATKNKKSVQKRVPVQNS